MQNVLQGRGCQILYTAGSPIHTAKRRSVLLAGDTTLSRDAGGASSAKPCMRSSKRLRHFSTGQVSNR